jgi:hypothetical protein
MLAGSMKLKHFLLIALGLLGAAIAGGYLACRDGTSASRDTPAAKGSSASRDTPAAKGSSASRDTPAAAKPDGSAAAMRDVDRAVFQWRGKELGGDKKKDVTAGRPYKVNLYQDSGQSAMNRAKIDLDRDDKWDEKWTFDDAGVSRKVAPNDDEDYTESYAWDGSAWVAQ